MQVYLRNTNDIWIARMEGGAGGGAKWILREQGALKTVCLVKESYN